MLSRRDLVCRVQPVCARFHAICEQNVPSVHLITYFGQFLNNLVNNLPEANRQYDNLANNRADLAKHIRIDWGTCFILTADMDNSARIKRYQRVQKCVLKHSLELFVGCHLIIYFNKCQHEGIKEVFAYLDILQGVHPTQITLASKSWPPTLPKFWHIDAMLRYPAILDCLRLSTRWAISTSLYSHSSDKSSAWKMMPCAETVFNWLHFLPTNFDEYVQQYGISERIIVVDPILPSSFEKLIHLCIEHFSQAISSTDCRSFVVHAKTTLVDQPHKESWYIPNDCTGEILLFEHVIFDEVPDELLRLRRCQANALKDVQKFIDENFEHFLLFKDFRAKNRNAGPTLTFE